MSRRKRIEDRQTVDVKTLAGLLKQHRQQAGLSLRDVTKATGVSASTLSRIENGKGDPDFRQILCIARYLNVGLEVVKGEPRNSLEAIREILCADGSLRPEWVPPIMSVIASVYKLART